MKTYHEFMKERLSDLRAQGLEQGDAMRQLGKEWKEYKANQGGKENVSPPIEPVSDQTSEPPKRKRGRPRKKPEEVRRVKESKLKGLDRLQSLRLEVPYLVEAEPDVAAAWDVAEGIVDYLLENARGIDDAAAFQRRAAAAYLRAKGGTSTGDQTEYELGKSLGETLLLVMAHRGMGQAHWQAMAPHQLGAYPGDEPDPEDDGLISSGLEMLGLKDPDSTSSKAVKAVKDKATETAVDVVGQTVLDLLR